MYEINDNDGSVTVKRFRAESLSCSNQSGIVQSLRD